MLPVAAATWRAADPRGDVCHVHADRAAAEQCGVLLGGAPELVRLDEVRPAVYRVAWSLSSNRERPATSPAPGLVALHETARPSPRPAGSSCCG